MASSGSGRESTMQIFNQQTPGDTSALKLNFAKPNQKSNREELLRCDNALEWILLEIYS